MLVLSVECRKQKARAPAALDLFTTAIVASADPVVPAFLNNNFVEPVFVSVCWFCIKTSGASTLLKVAV